MQLFVQPQTETFCSWSSTLSSQKLPLLEDPVFEKLTFNDNRAVYEALQRITAAAAKCTPSSQRAPPLEGQVEEEPQTSAVWRLFDERATGDAARRNTTADVMMEMRCDLEEPLIQQAEDPLSWWQAKASVFPQLAKVMEGRLYMVATSVLLERIFSKTGQILTERRSSISPSKMRYFSECQPSLRTRTVG